jgi:carboxyl-terminal processing protease
MSRVISALLMSLLLAAHANGEPRTVPLEELAPTKEQRRATTLVTQFLSRHHYRKLALDDRFSAELLERYLETLDPQRSFFLQADIDQFMINKHRLDDMLRRAQVNVAFDIFKQFRGRVDERVDGALAALVQGFSFDVTEDYRFDRREADWAQSEAALDDLWRRRVKNDVLTQRLAGKEQKDIVDILSKRYGRLRRHYQQVDSNDVFQLYMSAYGRTIEPHTTYLSPRSSENFRIRMSLSLEGIGAALQTENEYTVVRRIITGGPAELDEGLKVDDRIVGVAQGDGPIVDVVAWRLEDVVELIRGKKGTTVRLDILPKGAGATGKHHVLALVRDKVKLEEQAAKRSIITLPGDAKRRVGVIDLPTFYLDIEARSRGDADYRSTTRDVRNLLSELKAEKVDGVIIDLRGNSGGSLVEATDLTGLFIDTGPVVQMRYSDGRIQVNKDNDKGVAYDGPVAVLVDRFSASASEIFAGAIQDYKRGLVLGEPTFGKGTVQHLVPLDRYAEGGVTGLGHLKMTVAKFFRVNGHSTQHRGVIPDIIYPTALGTESVGERALENALEWSKTAPAYYSPAAGYPGLVDNLRVRHEDRVNADARFTYLVAEAQAIKDNSERKSISLSETARRAEQDEREAQSLTRENKLRAAKGLGARDPDAEGDESETFTEVLGDAILDESAHILIDSLASVARPRSTSLETAVN